ncbi:MAG: gluconate 2-dehydrogenase subunit 3 family protein [Colwellia sp.]|nr:gluconate 2-dehydrogenase subunit 3 family protein [Colwellia sp.]
MKNLTRREFIARVSVLMTSALLPTSIETVAAAFTFNDRHNSTGQTKSPSPLLSLNKSQFEIIEVIVDIIIPDTDTPGANKAGVPIFIDHMLANFMPQSEQQAFISDLKLLDKDAKGFGRLSPQHQYQYIETLDNNRHQNSFYRKLKELTVLGYYTSEIGASEELKYNPVPGPYREIPFNSLGRAWS